MGRLRGIFHLVLSWLGRASKFQNIDPMQLSELRSLEESYHLVSVYPAVQG